MRFLGLVVALLVLVYGAVVAAGAASVRPGVPEADHGSQGASALEAAGEHREAPAPIAPTDLNDDDDEQEVSAEPSRVVPWRWPVALRTAPQSETIRPSLGHPRGIDDPPRS